MTDCHPFARGNFLYLQLFLARSEVDAFHHRVFEVQPVFFRIILASGAFFGGSSLPFLEKYILQINLFITSHFVMFFCFYKLLYFSNLCLLIEIIML